MNGPGVTATCEHLSIRRECQCADVNRVSLDSQSRMPCISKTAKKFLEIEWLSLGGIPQANYVILAPACYGFAVGRESEFCLEECASWSSLLLRCSFQGGTRAFCLHIPQLRYIVFPVIVGDNRFTIGRNCSKCAICIQKMDRQLVSCVDIPILQLNAAPILVRCILVRVEPVSEKTNANGFPRCPEQVKRLLPVVVSHARMLPS